MNMTRESDNFCPRTSDFNWTAGGNVYDSHLKLKNIRDGTLTVDDIC